MRRVWVVICAVWLFSVSGALADPTDASCRSNDEDCYWRYAEQQMEHFRFCLALPAPPPDSCGQTDSACRWRRLADEIAAVKPHLSESRIESGDSILQCAKDDRDCRFSAEVSTFRVLSDYVINSPERAGRTCLASTETTSPNLPKAAPQSRPEPDPTEASGRSGYTRAIPPKPAQNDLTMWLLQNPLVVIGVLALAVAALLFVVIRLGAAVTATQPSEAANPTTTVPARKTEHSAVPRQPAAAATSPAAPAQSSTLPPRAPPVTTAVTVGTPASPPTAAPPPPQPAPITTPPAPAAQVPPLSPPTPPAAKSVTLAPPAATPPAQTPPVVVAPPPPPVEAGASPEPMLPPTEAAAPSLTPIAVAPVPPPPPEPPRSAPPIADVIAPAAPTRPEPKTLEEAVGSWLANLDVSIEDQLNILTGLNDEVATGRYNTLRQEKARRLAAAFVLTDFFAPQVFEGVRARPATAALVETQLGDHEVLIWPDEGAPFDRTRHRPVQNSGGHTVLVCLTPGLATDQGIYAAQVKTA